MLDFYFIKDGQPKTNNAQKMGLEPAGSLDDYTFEELQRREIIDLRFDYYSTFRWDTRIIKQIQENLKHIDKKDDCLGRLQELLEKASKRESGLIAYGD